MKSNDKQIHRKWSPSSDSLSSRSSSPEDELRRRRVVTSDHTLGLPTARRWWRPAVPRIYSTSEKEVVERVVMNANPRSFQPPQIDRSCTSRDPEEQSLHRSRSPGRKTKNTADRGSGHLYVPHRSYQEYYRGRAQHTRFGPPRNIEDEPGYQPHPEWGSR